MSLGAVHHPAVRRLLLGGILLAGLLAIPRLPVVLRAPVELPRLTVTVQWPGASALLVEREVTAPIERLMHGVRGITTVRSTSREGEAVIDVTLAPGADAAWVRLGVREQLELRRPTFPAGASAPELSTAGSPAAAGDPLALLTLHGPRTPRALLQLLETHVAPRLRTVPGVARVSTFGVATAGLQVTVDPAPLRAYGLSPARVAEQLGTAALIAPVGVARSGGREHPVRIDDRLASVAALAQVPIPGSHGQRPPLAMLAAIRDGDDDRGRFHRLNGQAVMGLQVDGASGRDSRLVMAQLRQVVARMTGDLPGGMALRVVHDGTITLARQLRDIGWRALVVAGGILLLLRGTERSWSAAGWSLATVAGAIALTCVVLSLRPRPVPLTSLVALVLVSGPLAMQGRRTPMGSLGLLAALAIPVALLPLPVRALAGPPVLALLGVTAGVAVVTIVGAPLHAPAHERAQASERRPAHAAPRGSRSQADGRFRHPLWSLLATALLTTGAFRVVASVEATRNESSAAASPSSLRVDLEAPRGTDPVLIDQVLRPFERLALTHPGVATTRASGAGAQAHLLVEFHPTAHRTPAPGQLYDRFVQRSTQVGGMAVFVRGSGPGFHTAGASINHSVYRFQVAGYGWEPLARFTADVVSRLERLPRIRDLRVTSSPWRDEPPARTIDVQPDRAALARLGMPVRAVAAAVAGEAGGRIPLTIGGVDQQATVRMAGYALPRLEQLGETPLPVMHRQRVRLRDVTTHTARPTPEVIVREA